MSFSTSRILWIAFAALVLLVAGGVALNLFVLQLERAQNERTHNVYEPLIERMMSMDRDIASMLGSARGYTLTERSEFLAQYDDAARSFLRTATAAERLASGEGEKQMVRGMTDQFATLKAISDRQIELTDAGRRDAAIGQMLEASRHRRSAADFAGTFAEEEALRRASEINRANQLRQALTLVLVLVGLAIVLFAVLGVLRVERSIHASIRRQTRKTEAIVAGMADGVMLVNQDGTVVFINPAGVLLLGKNTVDVPIDQQPSVYGFRGPEGAQIAPNRIPAALALESGQPVKDVSISIEREGVSRIDVSMSAVPILEEGRVTGAVVSFRDITERRRFEEETRLQAERAQILADAGAFFSSNIDPDWVTQAIVERIAQVLGDWCAVILKQPGSNDLNVAAIYHRDMASLGLAWAHIYRQPLAVGEGIIGEVIGTGSPSLTSGLEPNVQRGASTTDQQTGMKLASMLVLPLRTRQTIIGALVITAHNPENQMTEEKLPLAEVLAERAALAIENARLYTEQVEARRKVEDLSRLKDEFLSIVSHELRTPVTSIKGYTQLARTLIGESDVETAEEYLVVALDQIDRMSRLILELLDVSRIETGRLEIRRETMRWAEFVREVVDHHHTASGGRRFYLSVPATTSPVLGDRDRLEQVLGNLLENAVKYSPEGTDVFVEVRDDGQKVITSIKDQGMGIPADEIGQVFERFHRGRQVSSTNYGGLGLGLYISKQIVERHSGSIWVESREGQGTTFSFALPAYREEAANERSAASQTGDVS